MEHPFLSKVIDGNYSENEIAKIFAEALDQMIYNRMLQDFIKRSGIDIDEMITKAKATMMEDFTETAKAKGVPMTEETLSKFETGIEMGALQIRENLGLSEGI